MKKDFITDEGKVRKCDSNLVKMNIFEFIFYYIFHWGYFRQIFSYIYESTKGFLSYSFSLFYNITCFLFTPITLIACAVIQIKEAKKRYLKNK